MTLYRILADLVVLVHVGYVGFVLFGMLAIVLGVFLHWSWVRNFWFRVVHLAMIGIVVVESLVGIVCPLTTWENALRAKAGDAEYSGSFIGELLHELLFVDAAPWVLTLCYCLFGAVVVITFWLAPPRWPGNKSTADR